MYSIWRVCERFSMKPPGVKDDFMENDEWTKALLIAYGQIRRYEELQDLELQSLRSGLSALL